MGSSPRLTLLGSSWILKIKITWENVSQSSHPFSQQLTCQVTTGGLRRPHLKPCTGSLLRNTIHFLLCCPYSGGKNPDKSCRSKLPASHKCFALTVPQYKYNQLGMFVSFCFFQKCFKIISHAKHIVVFLKATL